MTKDTAVSPKPETFSPETSSPEASLPKTSSKDQEARDRRFMALAMRLGARGLGTTAPNPSVGCVLVAPETGEILARSTTGRGGRPHAEALALAEAGSKARGATAYVTLEPCAHHGKTPPCAEALIAAGVARVVYAVGDPDPRVAGRGAEKLKAAGLAVTEGICAAEGQRLAQGFFSRVTKARPMVTVKLASSLDGRIAAQGGVSQWITGPAARAHGHGLRARHDAIMVGAKTAILDNPQLTCRLPGLEARSPIRVVTDGQLRLPLTHTLIATASQTPTWVLTSEEADPARVRAFQNASAVVLPVRRDKTGGLDLKAALAVLAERGLTRLMVEGGAGLVASLVAADMVDWLYWYRAPVLLGANGVPGVGGLDVANPRSGPRFVVRDRRALGEDVLDCFERAPQPEPAA